MIQGKLIDWLDDIEEWYSQVDVKLDDFLKRLYDHVHGVQFGLIGFLTYVLSTLAAMTLYLLVDPSYSIFTHWISHLGDGPNGANTIFNIGWIISSGILFLFLTHEIRYLRVKGVIEWTLDIMSLAALSFSLGVLLVGIFPLHLGMAHTIAALFYFIGGITYFFMYGLLLLTISGEGILRSLFAFITVACHLFYFFSPVITPYTNSMGITMFFLEWLVLISEVSMILMMLAHYFTSKVNERKSSAYKERVKDWIRKDWSYKNELVEFFDSFYY